MTLTTKWFAFNSNWNNFKLLTKFENENCKISLSYTVFYIKNNKIIVKESNLPKPDFQFVDLQIPKDVEDGDVFKLQFEFQCENCGSMLDGLIQIKSQCDNLDCHHGECKENFNSGVASCSCTPSSCGVYCQFNETVCKNKSVCFYFYFTKF